MFVNEHFSYDIKFFFKLSDALKRYHLGILAISKVNIFSSRQEGDVMQNAEECYVL